LLAPLAHERGGRLFASVAGPLQTPRRVVEAVLSGEVDAGPLDSYFHDLLRTHEPALGVQLRVLASTPLTPIPALVAAPNVPDAAAQRLTAALLAVAGATELAPVRAALLLRRFATVDAADYSTLAAAATRADAAGYPRIA
jgi:ABC-type phosphate/phosphonate transport system substrate-binding protein